MPGFESSAWIGVAAPKGTPAEIINNLTDPKIKARFAELSGVVLGGTPTDFGKHIAEETEKWGKVIRSANIKPE